MIYYKYIIIILLFLFSCSFPHKDSEKSDFIIKKVKDSFILVWEPPSDMTPDSYNVYYKKHTYINWTLYYKYCNDTKVIIERKNLDGGKEYDFGVSAIYNYINESAIHSSLDKDASPDRWYAEWIN